MKTFKTIRNVLLLGLFFVMVNNMSAYAVELRAKADIINREGAMTGEVLFYQEDDGPVTVRVNLYSFSPGMHAFHIHGSPLCEPPDFKSAGGHFNPYDKKHGFLSSKGHHAGDLPNITVDKEGSCDTTFVTDQITLRKTKNNSLFKEPGTSVVIHENPDDYYTDPAGMGGRRLACGAITQIKQ